MPLKDASSRLPAGMVRAHSAVIAKGGNMYILAGPSRRQCPRSDRIIHFGRIYGSPNGIGHKPSKLPASCYLIENADFFSQAIFCKP